MSYTEFFFDKNYIIELAKQRAANLLENKGVSDFLGFALGVIVKRLEKDPMRYRDYGVYWPKVKEILRKNGYDYGGPIYPFLADVYTADSDLHTIVMADEFRSWYLRQFAIGTCKFVLDANNPIAVEMTDEYMDGIAH